MAEQSAGGGAGGGGGGSWLSPGDYQYFSYSPNEYQPSWWEKGLNLFGVKSYRQTELESQQLASQQQQQLIKTFNAYEQAVNNAKDKSGSSGDDQVKPEDIKKEMRTAASNEGMQYGGWYDNPATGRNQRYWGNGIWTDGEEPNFGSEVSVEEIANLAPTMPAIPPFEYDYIQAERDALEKLRPYYEELLAEADGDFELARQRLEEDYATGTRQMREDFQTVTDALQTKYNYTQRVTAENLAKGQQRAGQDVGRERRQAIEDFLAQSEEYSRLEPEEQAKVLDSLNRRGMLQSTIREQEQGNLNERQTARREAIQRAMERKEQVAQTQYQRDTQDLILAAQRAGEQATTGYQQGMAGSQTDYQRALEQANTGISRGTEDLATEQERTARALEEQKTQEAASMVELDRQRKFDKYMQEQLQNISSYSA
jgi:hypothetical protein